jgi:hypothetical protein
MKIHLRGHAETNSVWLNGKKLSLSKSLKVVNHSPTGFSWGYMGSGCAQLALAICIELFGKEQDSIQYTTRHSRKNILHHYQREKTSSSTLKFM